MTPRVEGRVYAAPIPHSLAELEAQFDAAAARPMVEGDTIVFTVEVDGAVIGLLRDEWERRPGVV